MHIGPFRMTVFSGLAGRALRKSASIESTLVGFLLVGGLALTTWWLHRFESESAAPAFVLPALAIVLARYALEGTGRSGRASFFAGTDWGATLAIAIRFIVLSLIWVVPLVLWRASLADGEGFGFDPTMLMFDRRMLALLSLYVAAQLLSPPLFLIAATDAERWLDLVRPAKWGAHFRRGSDLFLIYALHLGAITMMTLLVLPVLVPVALRSTDAAIFFGAVAAVFLFGFGTAMLGRLCGTFAGFSDDTMEVAPATATAQAGPAGPATRDAVRPPVYAPARRAPAEAIAAPTIPTGAAATNGAASSSVAGSPAPAEPVPAVIRPPLLNARERVNEIRAQAGPDAAAALAGLSALREQHAPNPLVLHAMAELLLETSRHDDARAVMAEAFPLFFERGNIRPATEVYDHAAMRGVAPELKPEWLSAIGLELLEMKRPVAARPVLEQALNGAPWDRGVIKGLMQVAEFFLERDGRPEEARDVYTRLLDRCADSPMADMMRRGLHESERRVALATRRPA